VFFGDGATSEGAFHEGANFAAVMQAPLVLFCNNNQWAISTPVSAQTRAEALVDKAAGYGMPGIRVDGNDLAALNLVLGEAVARARSGGGPSLIEADTYRIEAHTNADDATRYRTDDEVAEWVARDPLSRLRTYLTGVGVLDESQEQEFAAQAEEMAAQIRAGVGAETSVNPDDLFAHVYTSLTPQLIEQRAALRNELTLEEAS
jgi:pyruvate dehydrogenase E1 component alpha subunit